MDYTIEFNGSGEVLEDSFGDDTEAQAWVESVLENLGYDSGKLVCGDWDADGQDDDGNQCERMLFWASEDDSENDPGVKSICQLCVIRQGKGD